MSIDNFKKAVKEVLSAPGEHEPQGLISKAQSSKVPIESINTAMAEVYQQSGNFSLRMGVNKTRSAIENMIRAANATELTGILMGSRDVVGKQFPNKYTLVRADKKHIEISSYEGQAPYHGGKIDIPVPAAVVLKAEYDQDYDSWSLVSIEKYQILTAEDLQKHLFKVMIPISAIDESYAYHKINDDKPVSSRPVVIGGTISKISPEAVFRFEEDNDGNKTSQLDHYNPVYCPREMKPDEMLPCVQFLMNSKKRGINNLRCHLSQQRKGTPTILIPDFIVACQEAAKKFKDPEAQAGNVNEYMKGWPVIVVGTVMRYNKSTGQDKSAQNWVDIGVSCIFDAEGIDIDGDAAQKKIADAPKPEAAAPHITTQSPPIEGPIQSTQPVAAEKKPKAKKTTVQQAPANPAPPVASEEEVIQNVADEIFPATTTPAETVLPAAQPPAATAPGSLPPMLLEKAKVISQYCMVLDVPPSQIDVAYVKDKMLDVITSPQGVLADVFIQKILDYLKAGGKV
jgi:hypothetical protein